MSQATLFSEPPRLCEWCQRQLEVARRGARWCGKKCRQTAFRLRLRSEATTAAAVPGRFAYADPPYPGRAGLYAGEASYAGEVDHAALVARLEEGNYAGWALSTAEDALEDVLPIVRRAVGSRVRIRTCAWVKPIAAAPLTFGLHNTWEPLIVVRGRQERPGKRDFLIAQPARFGGELIGRKPIAFAAWLFACLGMRPKDDLDDLFPGTGLIGHAWRELGRVAPAVGDGSPPEDDPRCHGLGAPEGGMPEFDDEHDEAGHSRPGTCSVCGDHACDFDDGKPVVLTCASCGTACPCECGTALCEIRAEVADA